MTLTTTGSSGGGMFRINNTAREIGLTERGIIVATSEKRVYDLCMYGTIPIAASFAEKGMEDDAVVQPMLAAFILTASLFGKGNRGFGLLMAATIGVPLYMRGGGTISLLQQWLSSGMTMGSADAFMITGPATKITNLGAVKIVLGVKNFVFYVCFTVSYALLSGLLIDYVFINA